MKSWINMKHNVVETLLGAVILAIASFFVVQTYKATGRNKGGDGYLVTAYFDRVDGVMIGTDVKVSGVKMGAVTAINMEPETYRAKVVLKVDKRLKIPTDSSAEVISESLLGGKYITIVPGIDDDHLKPNGTIKQTASAVNFESLISKFMLESGKGKSPKEESTQEDHPKKESSKTHKSPNKDNE